MRSGPRHGSAAAPRRRAARWAAGILAVGVVAGGVVVTNQSASAAVLFTDAFPGTSLSSAWTVQGGTWSVDGAGRLAQTAPGAALAQVSAGNPAWDGYTAQARVAPTAFGSGGFTGLAVHAASAGTFSRLVLTAAGTVELQVVRNGTTKVLSTAPFTATPGTWHTLRVSVLGRRLVGAVDGVKLVTGYGGEMTGRIALQTSAATARFAGVQVDTFGPATTTATVSPSPTGSATARATATATTATPTASRTAASPAASTTSPTPSPSTSTRAATASATAGPTVSPTATSGGGPTYAPGSAVAWSPPAAIASQLDQVLTHEEQTYSDLYGFKNYIFDQIMAGKGSINYCVRWDSSQPVTVAQRDATQATLQRQFDKWIAAMTDNGRGWNEFPYTHVAVKVVGWAVRDRAQLQWSDGTVDIYVNDINEGAPQCTPPCGRFFHQDNNYGGCPGGPGHHYDMSLWLTEGMQGGAGGDWGQRIGSEYFMTNLAAQDVHILLHEMGHGYGLDDFYDWQPTPSVGGFIMNAGSATRITQFDTWMLRNHWRKFKTRYL